MFKPEMLKASIESSMPGSRVDVQDTTGTGDHFQVTVVSDRFVGKSRVEQHQMVHAALHEAIEGDLHALGLKTYTPESWREAQARSGSA
ncbi:MAG TPA: BolA/IbaG family iron-sulfur metabolism protein [Armatimonadota bacterium]|nr:BolA/IbaG family iron-sulfur metabolism protein [Armatimonadota bacterium]